MYRVVNHATDIELAAWPDGKLVVGASTARRGGDRG
jgi:hypothetical protein